MVKEPGLIANERIPQGEETFSAKEQVEQYDKLCNSCMRPLYAYFAWRILRNKIKKGWVLDLGSGTAMLLTLLGRQWNGNLNLIGIDISKEMVQKANENTRKAGQEKRLDFQIATASHLPFRDRAFDLIISSYSLHHWSEPVTVFNEVQRVLKDGGIYLIRDAKRLPLHVFWRLFIWLSSWITGLDKKQKRHWETVIAACYTKDEVRVLLERSNLQNWIIRTDAAFFEFCIENVGKQ